MYNPNAFQVNLAGYTFSNTAGQTYTIPVNSPVETTVEGEGFLLFWMDDAPSQGGHHLGFEPALSDGTLSLRDGAPGSGGRAAAPPPGKVD